jgi:hypothetical protein
MMRLAAAVVATVCLSASPGWAQSTQLTVSVASATVYQAPSTGSVAIGTAPRGTVLEVTRELGSWVKVSWPAARDGIGYVHVSTGSIGPSVSAPRLTPSVTPPPAASGAEPPAPAPLRAERMIATPAPSTVYVTPRTHVAGLGGLMGQPSTLGASARAWVGDRLGLQVDVSRGTLTSAGLTGHVRSLQVAPSLLFSFGNLVSDYIWVRPYLGTGAQWRRQTMTGLTPDAGGPVSKTGFGPQVFGGGEMTFAAVPRFALSADLGYRWSQTPFAGFSQTRLGLSVSGHWYVK